MWKDVTRCALCEYYEHCEYAEQINFCEDCKDYDNCGIHMEYCLAMHEIECDIGKHRRIAGNDWCRNFK